MNFFNLIAAILVSFTYFHFGQSTNLNIYSPGTMMSEKQDLDGDNWKLLFNGKNLDGWHVKCAPGDLDKTYFEVINGNIVANSLGDTNHNYVWLMSNESYADFSLKLEFKLFEGARGNSGVQFRSKYTDSISWLDGPQVDICMDPIWRTGMIWDETRGNKRWLFPDLPNGKWVNSSMANSELTILTNFNERGWGDWNKMLVTAKGTNVRVNINGKLVTNYNGSGVLNSDIHQLYQVGMSGQFALQIHNKDEVKIAFRNIYLSEIE